MFVLTLPGVLLLHLINIEDILFLKINHDIISPYLCLFWGRGVLFVMLKALTSLSFFLIPYTFRNLPNLGTLFVHSYPNSPKKHLLGLLLLIVSSFFTDVLIIILIRFLRCHPLRFIVIRAWHLL